MSTVDPLQLAFALARRDIWRHPEKHGMVDADGVADIAALCMKTETELNDMAHGLIKKFSLEARYLNEYMHQYGAGPGASYVDQDRSPIDKFISGEEVPEPGSWNESALLAYNNIPK